MDAPEIIGRSILSASELAAASGESLSGTYKRIRRGDVAAVKVKGVIGVPAESAALFLATKGVAQ